MNDYYFVWEWQKLPIEGIGPRKGIQKFIFPKIDKAMCEMEGLKSKDIAELGEFERRYIYKGPSTKEEIAIWRKKIESAGISKVKEALSKYKGIWMRKLGFKERKQIAEIEQDETKGAIQKISDTLFFLSIYWDCQVIHKDEFDKLKNQKI
jgi:hypothetical protein